MSLGVAISEVTGNDDATGSPLKTGNVTPAVEWFPGIYQLPEGGTMMPWSAQ